jgi:hypothetical protein
VATAFPTRATTALADPEAGPPGANKRAKKPAPRP